MSSKLKLLFLSFMLAVILLPGCGGGGDCVNTQDFQIPKINPPNAEGWETYSSPIVLNKDNVLYCRASIAAVLGEKERAVELLKEAFAKGLTYGSYILADMDLENLRDYEPFKELMRPKG